MKSEILYKKTLKSELQFAVIILIMGFFTVIAEDKIKATNITNEVIATTGGGIGSRYMPTYYENVQRRITFL